MSSPAFDLAASQFGAGRGYLAAATMGLPPRSARVALQADLEAWSAGEIDPKAYDGVVDRTRASFAKLVGVEPSRVAVGSQTSVFTGLIAAAAPIGAEVLCVDGDFSSMVFPFLARDDLRIRHVPVDRLAESITGNTWLVAFSLVQSATGVVADTESVARAARQHGAVTFCDVTQAAGVLPVDASLFDATVCHSYKWLCAPRGVAFLTVTPALQSVVGPRHAGWYAGDDVWQSCYGPHMNLARDARRFDVSPAWQAWVGAEHSIALFASLDARELWAHATGLGDLLCDGLGIPRQGQAIVTWVDAAGGDLARLTTAGIRAAGRAGRLRAAFHLWNSESDVEDVIAALR